MKLAPDFERQLLRGEETIQFQGDAGEVEWQKQAGLHVVSANIPDGNVTVAEEAVRVRLRSGGRHSLKLEYIAAAGRGIRWFGAEVPRRPYSQDSGFATAFYCEAWMVCDTGPGQRATLRLEIIIPFKEGGDMGFRAVGPGRRGKEWRGRDGDHFVFEQSDPVQTYLFSFGVARLTVGVDGMFSIYAQSLDANEAAFAKTADAYAFLRGVASIDPMNSHYTQAFLPGPSMGQEAAGMALMSQDVADLAAKDDVQLMAHELAHQ